MARDKYFIYPRNKDGKRTGHTICVVLKDNKIFHGTAVCSNEDQFSRVKGRKLAEERAEEAYSKHKTRLESVNG